MISNDAQVRSKSFPWAWSFLQLVQSVPLGLGVPLAAILSKVQQYGRYQPILLITIELWATKSVLSLLATHSSGQVDTKS